MLHLAPLKQNRRDARFGFPVRKMAQYMLCAIGAGKSVVVILEDQYLMKIKERRIWRRFEGKVLDNYSGGGPE
nr:hypothetical protein [Desulfobulbaceae bacterium]